VTAAGEAAVFRVGLADDRSAGARIRVTTVASISGMKPSSRREPLIKGTPAMQIGSLIPTS
jgi:hypothetical protein